jgi:tetratricopeptide (TPR) repeat protein
MIGVRTIKSTYLDEYADMISYIIRKERSLRGLRLEDLADKTVSLSTISNIENQTAPVKETKIMHILEKLGITRDVLLKRINAENTEIKRTQNSLKLIEAMLNGKSLEEAKEKIDHFSLEEFHPLYPLALYFKGHFYYYKEDWDTAEKFIQDAIHTCKTYHLNPKPNFLSFCFSLLSSCSYYKNDLKKALTFVEEGFNHFNAEIQQNKIKYTLLGNKIIYLEKQGETTLALQLVQKVWDDIQEVESLHVKLNLYKSRANLLLKGNQFNEAIYFAQEGFDIAQSSPRNRFTFDLLMILGLIHLLQQDYATASEYFQTVICLNKNMEYPRRHVDAYTNLAILYNSERNWSLADDFSSKAITIGRETKDAYRLTRSLIVRGNYYLFQHLTSESIPLLEEAFSVAKENHFKQRQHKALFKLVECHDILENNEEFSALNKELFYLQKEIDLKGEDDIYDI